MPRLPRNQLSPWIEKLILSYNSCEEAGRHGGGGGGRLKAHVIGVGQMSQSQAQNSDGLTGLLFLSDGLLQIPAVLTAAAWERLQEQEDRECFTSLLNTTVSVCDYQLQFHMAAEQTRCRFFLLVGELATTAAGPVRDNTPCCTTAPSVRLKICETWRTLLGEEAESQKSQCGLDLSELLGEWQHDCVQAVLDDVRDRLTAAGGGSVSPQPSTSFYTPLPTLHATGWDVDRVRFKGAERFTVPVKCLLIPEDEAQQLQTRSHTVDTRGPSRPEAEPLSSDDADEWQIPAPAVAERHRGAGETSPLPVDDETRHEIDNNVTLLSNPWDIFPPPSTSSCEASPDATTTNTAVKPKPGHVAMATCTQLPVHIAEESQPTSEQSRELSDFPPYQNPPHSAGLLATPGSAELPFVSPPEPAEVSPPADQRKPSASDQKMCEKETTHRTAKRKRSEAAAEAEAEAQTSTEPPSWLFDTQAGSEDGGQRVTSVLRKTPSVHSSGRPFSYTYQVTGQNLQDFSGFTASESLLHWAVKYLLPKHKEPVTSDTNRGHITVGSTG